jgi:hypothetical protein
VSVMDTITNWPFLPYLLALIALGSALMALLRFTQNGTTTARRRVWRARRKERRQNRRLRRRQDRAHGKISRARSAYERSLED